MDHSKRLHMFMAMFSSSSPYIYEIESFLDLSFLRLFSVAFSWQFHDLGIRSPILASGISHNSNSG